MKQPDQRLSFGVEVEFLVPWRFDDEPDPHHGSPNLPPLFVIPSSMRSEIQEAVEPEQAAAPILFESIEETLRASGLSPQHPHQGKPPDPQPYRNWSVTTDTSVCETEDDKYQSPWKEGRTFRQWIAVELASPAEFESAAAFAAVAYAVGLMKQAYRCRVNPSCSVHVHVGVGRRAMDLGMVRRAAALAYAAEPLLFALHDPRRRVTSWCKPVREYSNLAMGRFNPTPRHAYGHGSNSRCVAYLGRHVRHGEQPISWRAANASPPALDAFRLTRQPGHFEPFLYPGPEASTAPVIPTGALASGPDTDSTIPTPSGAAEPRRPTRRRTIPRLRFPRPSNQRLGELSDELQAIGVYSITSLEIEKRSAGDVGVFEATRRIYEAESSCIVHRLLETGFNDSVSFGNYGCAQLQDENTKPTVEFRLAAGALDDWVMWWARICVGLVRFALYSPPGEFLGVLQNCDTAAKQDGHYDVLDLLDDVCLFAEAEVAEKRFARNKDEWKLEFV